MDQVIAETVLGGSMVGKEQIKVFKVYQFLADHMCCSKLHSIKVHMCWWLHSIIFHYMVVKSLLIIKSNIIWQFNIAVD